MTDICKCGKPTGGMYACSECREKIAAYKRKWRANMTDLQHEKELEKHRVWRKKNYATLKTYNHEYYLRKKEMYKMNEANKEILAELKRQRKEIDNKIRNLINGSKDIISGSARVFKAPNDYKYTYCQKDDLIVSLTVCGIDKDGTKKYCGKPICFGKNKEELSTKLESIINDLSELKNKLESEDEENADR